MAFLSLDKNANKRQIVTILVLEKRLANLGKITSKILRVLKFVQIF
jgi:hypothetical protein